MNAEGIVRLANRAEKPLIIAIDGRCAAGKTTLAKKLSAALSAPVVHMDDFYLPFAARTPERLAQPGGNLDRERFIAQVCAPLSRGEAFHYGVFDCSRGVIAGERAVPRADIVIIEGAYSLHPELRGIYGMRIFCDIDRETQLLRLRSRESAESFRQFVERWIPMEEKYLSAFDVKSLCDIIYTPD